MELTLRLYSEAARDCRQFGGSAYWLCFRCLPALLMMTMILLFLSVRPVYAAAHQGADINGVEAGHLLLRYENSDIYKSAVVQRSRVHFDISGMVATVRVEQTFRNDSADFVEGVYAFPLPDDAAVRYMEMVIGERRIVGKIREKQAAQKIYQAAKKAGKKASLVEQQRPNLFTNRVANIGPGEEVTVHLEYVQAVQFEADVFSLRFPMTITPRYMPGAPLPKESAVPESDYLPTSEVLELGGYQGWARATDQVPDANAISPVLHPEVGSDEQPLNPIEITAELDVGMPLAQVDAAYHDIALSRRAGVYSIELVTGTSEMDRDFILSWQPVTGAAPKAALFAEEHEGEHYGLLMIVPPLAQVPAAQLAREIVFVVDTSGSMSGVSIEQARASLHLALGRLQPKDRFNIIEFNSSHRALYRRSMPATSHHVQYAQEFVRQLDASGGTEMMGALQAALSMSVEPELSVGESALRQVIFITDGAVGNEAALFEEIASKLGESRLFTVGIGSAPNSWFMRKAAEFGRGTHTHIGDTQEVGEKMDALFDQLSHPAMVDVLVQWPGAVDAWPERVPDLYYGQPLSLAVKFGEQMPAGEVVVSGTLGGHDWRQRLRVDNGELSANGNGHDGIASLWARRKIGGLLDQKVRGRPEAEVRADILPLALAHQLLSPYTSFVAVEERISRAPGSTLGTAPVPNTGPRGQGPQAYAYPRTATTGPAKAWMGMLALFLALIVRALREPEAGRAPGA